MTSRKHLHGNRLTSLENKLFRVYRQAADMTRSMLDFPTSVPFQICPTDGGLTIPEEEDEAGNLWSAAV